MPDLLNNRPSTETGHDEGRSRKDGSMDDLKIAPIPSTPAKPFPGFAQALLVLFLFFLFTGIAGIPAIAMKRFGFTRALPWILLAGQLGGTAFLLWIFTTRGDRNWRKYFPHRPVTPSVWPLVMLAMVGIILLSNGIGGLVERILPPPAWLNQVFEDMGWQGVVIGAPLTEEPIFRGLLLGGFLLRYGPRKAVAYSALLFALVHGNPWQLPTALLAGIFLGWLMIQTGSLWPCVLAHFINNLGSVISDKFHVPYLSGTGLQPLWMWALGAILTVIAIWSLRRILATPAGDSVLVGVLP